MSLFEHKDYRSYIRDYIRALPKKGRGELLRISQHLKMNSTLLSQIMSGLRDFNPEQAYALSVYLGHSETEMEYFSLLVQHERASTVELKKYIVRKLGAIKNEALKLSQRIVHEKKLADQERAVFYSSWIYSAVHLFTSTSEKGVTLEAIASRFRLTKSKSAEILRFLTASGICREDQGRYTMGVQSTFVERGSPFLLKHHSNWRVKAIQKSESLSDAELMYTGQFSLSRKDFELLRERFTQLLKETNSLIKDSKAEEIACLNLDWVWIET